jgi:hypothetical protein
MYLFYQAILMVLASGKSTYPADRQSRKKSLAGMYRQGAITNILNPKVALFFMALLPQFILPASPNKPLSFILLGLVIITTGTGWCLFLALLPLFSVTPIPAGRDNEGMKAGALKTDMAGLSYKNLAGEFPCHKMAPARQCCPVCLPWIFTCYITADRTQRPLML